LNFGNFVTRQKGIEIPTQGQDDKNGSWGVSTPHTEELNLAKGLKMNNKEIFEELIRVPSLYLG